MVLAENQRSRGCKRPDCCPVEADGSFAIGNSHASLKAQWGWGEMCSWELVVVSAKMSMTDTIGQVSLKTLLGYQMEFLGEKDLLANWIARESAQTTQLYPLWGKPALFLGSTKAWHLGKLFSSCHGVHISPGTALTHVLVTASWLTGFHWREGDLDVQAENWAASLEARCFLFLSPPNSTKRRNPHKTALEDVRIPLPQPHRF